MTLSSWEARSDGVLSPADDDIPFPAALVQHTWKKHGFYNAGDLKRANTKLQVMRYEHYQRHAEKPTDHDHIGDELWAFGIPRPTPSAVERFEPEGEIDYRAPMFRGGIAETCS